MICRKCSQDLEETSFHWKNKAKGLRHTICKVCKSLVDSNHYQRSEKRRTGLRVSSKDRHEKIRGWFTEYKSKLFCLKCSEARPYMLDFHHIDREDKDNEIVVLVGRACSIERIQKELDKCLVLCSNCHREFHHFERLLGITTKQYLDGVLVEKD